MRRALREVIAPFTSARPTTGPTEHIGLSYGAWAPTGRPDGTPGDEGKVPDKLPGNDKYRSNWLAAVAATPIHPHYQHSFDRWETSLRGDSRHRLAVIEMTSRLLVGHGNPSATEVGLTVHHTWGVPIIPGSALKGICASYVARQVGGAEPEREPYRGVEWQGKRIVRGPGEIYAALFGAPDADNGAEAEQGGVAFHDALYVPGSTPGDRPFAVDVLTVHQRSYYGQTPGGGDPGSRWPNDYDSPNPVGFVTVRPGTRLLVALGGEPEWTALARHLLGAALIEGVGGKSSAGYGTARILDR